MKLEQLLEGVPFTLAQGSLDTEISDIIYDSRKAAPGLLFVCIVGTQRDSHEFAADCAAKGVSALVIQHDIDLSAMPGVTVVKVESYRNCDIQLFDHALYHADDGRVTAHILACALRNTEDNRRLALLCGEKDSLCPLKVVDVELTNSVLAVTSLVQHFFCGNES